MSNNSIKNKQENALLIDVQYVRPKPKENLSDYLYLVWKDVSTGEKFLTTVESPTVDIYFEKPEFRNHVLCKRIQLLDNLEKRTVRYKDVIPAIAEDMGPAGMNYLSRIYDTKDYKRLREFNLYPYVFASDYDIRALYRIKWLNEIDKKPKRIVSKGFLDIEADSLRQKGFANAANSPVDLVTLIDRTTMTSYTFALVNQEFVERNPKFLSEKEKRKEEVDRAYYESRHKQEKELMENLDSFKEELDSLFSEHYGKIDYKFYFYSDERKLLVHLFQLINKLKLDFIGIWNISFDIPYILERMKVLGLNPTEIICHPDFKSKECYFSKDKLNFQVKNKADYFHCSSYTVFYDQMILYAAIRKGDKDLRTTKLTDIARDEIGDEKLNYEEDGSIKTVAYRNYKKYVMYNIKDVLLQVGIEDRTTDFDTLYVSSYLNATPYESVFKPTVKLRNFQYISYLKDNSVPGNNINIFNNVSRDEMNEDNENDSELDAKFEGALVGNPLLNAPFGEYLYGKKSNSVFNYSVDMDMSSFYPYTIDTHNIDPTTLYFKVIVDSNQFKPRGGALVFNGKTDEQIVKTNKNSFEGDIAKEIFDNFHTRNWISTAHKWNNLPSVSQIYKQCKMALSN